MHKASRQFIFKLTAVQFAHKVDYGFENSIFVLRSIETIRVGNKSLLL